MKKIIRFLIQIIFRYLVYFRFNETWIYSKNDFLRINIPEYKHIFCGYYTVSPFSKTNDNIIFCATDTEDIRAKGSEALIIGIYNLTTHKTKILGSSFSWNWQQGAMAQWVGNSNCIILNKYSRDTDNYYSEIIDLNGVQLKKFDIPIYKVAPDGSYALSLNFKRLAKLRPDYGYFCHQNKQLPLDNDDGIYYLNLETGEFKLIISIDVLKNFMPDKKMNNSVHKVNHIDISPNCERFLFLHRWYYKTVKYTRLLSANIKGNDLKFHKGNQFVSHNCWYGNDSLISFCRYDGKVGYVKIDNLGSKYNPFLESVKYDGHPIVNSSCNYMVTDYANPDISGFKNLYLYSFKEKKSYKLGHFYMPKKFSGEFRVDLHPKWNAPGDKISIDFIESGKRTIGIMNIQNRFDK